MSDTLGYATIQNVTYTEFTIGSGVTVAYTSGATLGISFVGAAMTVTFIPGTTTNAQIVAFVNGHSFNMVKATTSSGATTPTAPVSSTALTTGEASNAPVCIPIPVIVTTDEETPLS